MIYVIKSGKNTKIGYTKNIDKRIKSFKTHNPNFQLISIYDGGRELEKDLHKGLSPFRIKGTEWFEECFIVSVPEYVDRYCFLSNVKRIYYKQPD